MVVLFVVLISPPAWAGEIPTTRSSAAIAPSLAGKTAGTRAGSGSLVVELALEAIETVVEAVGIVETIRRRRTRVGRD
jgi:hypothetical protein